MRARTPALGLALAASLAIGTGSAHAAAGGLDPTFGTGGLVTLVEPGAQRTNRVVAQPDGKLIVVGRSANSGPVFDGLVRRLNRDGSPDAGFGGDGTVTLDSGGTEATYDAALQPDGKIVVVVRRAPAPGERTTWSCIA
ncbi:MAG: delta-60 repeat domain-containing protein [Chloroflexota bacterium]|nr:delta-60 repeat domain-containing protein [Chloroflexota bacterium]